MSASGRSRAAAVSLWCASAAVEALERRALLSASLVADAVGLYPTESVAVGERSFFTADDGVHGRELWASDGTPAGTVMVRDITPGSAGTRVRAMIALDGLLLFNVKQRDGALALWRSDGTEAGTTLVHRFDEGIWVSEFATLHGKALFVTAPSAGVVDLWTSDGTSGGTQFVTRHYDDGPLELPVSPQFHPAGDRMLWFDANSELYSTDGTAEGTFSLFHAIDPDEHWVIYGINQFQGQTLFNAHRGGITTPGTVELWRTDGTVAGSQMLHEFPGGSNGVLSLSGDLLYFVRAAPEPDNEERLVHYIYATDSTAGGTRLVTELHVDGGMGVITPLADGSILYIVHSRPNRETEYSLEVWRAGGPLAQPVAVKKVTPDLANAGWQTELGGITFFLAYGPGTGRCELWRSDGTPEGTVMVQDISAPAITPLGTKLTVADGKLVLTRPSGGTLVFDPETMKAPQGPAEGAINVTDRVMRVLGTSDDDVIKIYRHAQDPQRFVVNLNGVRRSFAFADVRKILIHGYSGDDNIATNEVNGLVGLRTVIWGGPGNDTLCTGAGWDTLWGQDGDDVFHSSRGHDVVSGGNGADLIRASTGDDTLSGNSGNDQLFGNTGRDIISGGDGTDQIDGGVGVDVLFGQSVLDVFFNGGVAGDPVDDEVLFEP